MNTRAEKSIEEKKVEITFLFLGIGSLLVFNAYLSELHFFKYFLKNHNPEKLFTTINNGLSLFLLILFTLFGEFISYIKQLMLFQILSLITLVFVPFVIIYLDESISIIVFYILLVFTGIAKAFANSSVMALSSFFPIGSVVNVGVGLGIAGILSNILNIIILFFFSEKTEEGLKKGAYFFFFISAGIIAVSTFLSINLFKNSFFLEIAKRNGIIKGNVEEKDNEKETELVELSESKENENENKKQKQGFSLLQLIKKLLVINILMFLLFFTLFMVFPGALIKPELFGLEPGIKINLILLIFSISDTIGRKLVGAISVNIKTIYVVVIIRFFLLGLTLFNIYGEQTGIISKNVVYFLTIINPILLAASNGIGCSLCFAIAPTQVEEKWKGRAGISISLFLALGLFFGSLCSIKVKDIYDNFGK